MVKNKNKLKQKNVINEDMSNVRNSLILLLIVVGVCVGLYFLTENMIKKENKSSDNKTDVKIDYDIATIGTMFNRVENEYYVILYSSKDDGKNLDSVLTTYRSSDDYIMTYYVDLDKKVNSDAIGDSLVKNPKKSSEVKVNGATLYKIKNGVIIDCYSGVDNIKKVLK